jgi:hypothetical protein
VLRDFYGSLISARAQLDYVVASTTFTSRAYTFAKNKPIKLIDLDALIELPAGHLLS